MNNTEWINWFFHRSNSCCCGTYFYSSTNLFLNTQMLKSLIFWMFAPLKCKLSFLTIDKLVSIIFFFVFLFIFFLSSLFYCGENVQIFRHTRNLRKRIAEVRLQYIGSGCNKSRSSVSVFRFFFAAFSSIG